MSPLLRKAIAFIRRDFQIESSYKMNFVMNVIDSMMILIFFYFLNELVAQRRKPLPGALWRQFSRLQRDWAGLRAVFPAHAPDVLGIYSGGAAKRLPGSYAEQSDGRLDDCPDVIPLRLIIWSRATLLILVTGALVMGVDLSHMNLPATMLVLLFSILTFVAFGVLSAATILWLKKGDPLAWILGGLGTMLGGAYFPVDVLPQWLRQISFLIPITYSLDALRLTMLKGYSLEMVATLFWC